jgi:hypothetical protein
VLTKSTTNRNPYGALMCRLSPHMGGRVGGQGAVVFAQHINSPTQIYAIKFFLDSRAFEVERAAVVNPVRVCLQTQCPTC